MDLFFSHIRHVNTSSISFRFFVSACHTSDSTHGSSAFQYSSLSSCPGTVATIALYISAALADGGDGSKSLRAFLVLRRAQRRRRAKASGRRAPWQLLRSRSLVNELPKLLRGRDRLRGVAGWRDGGPLRRPPAGWPSMSYLSMSSRQALDRAISRASLDSQ